MSKQLDEEEAEYGGMDLKDVYKLRTRIQKLALSLIAQFSERIPDTAHFISSFLRELMLCILNAQQDRTFVPTEEINNVISKHAFLTHFSNELFYMILTAFRHLPRRFT